MRHLQLKPIPEGVEFTLLVADNEAEPNNRETVTEFAASCPFAVVYVHEPRRGISRARNALLRVCNARFDWVAMTDDDCRPTPTWLADMLAAAARHGADVVRGRHIWVPPETGPTGTAPRRRHAMPRVRASIMPAAATCYSPAGSRASASTRAWPTEDTDFFHRAALQGARIVYSGEPVIHEPVPFHRATLRYQTVRSFYYAASRSHFHRR